MRISRRGLLSTGVTLLAGFGVSGTFTVAAKADPAHTDLPHTDPRVDLARFRPTTASTTAYAATPPAFAVDGLAHEGVRGSGWRAGTGDPQWIAVDLQAVCRIESVTLVFEATLTDPAFDGSYFNTYGHEILSSAAVAFQLDVSSDGAAWRPVYQTDSGPGGTVVLPLDQPVTARWVRLTATRRSNANPVGLNGFQVYGTCEVERPPAKGWTSWGVSHHPPPALAVAVDGTVPVESGWMLTLDDLAPTQDGAALSRPDVDVSAWLAATVPGTVLGSLVAQGHFPDPVAGFANLHIPEALSRHSWWYRRSFELPHGFDTTAGRLIWLEFDGVNHLAEVWVDGAQIGALAHPFARGAFDITGALRGTDSSRKHAIAVRITPMPHPGTPGDKSANGNTFVQSGRLYLDSPTYLAASGWDWMPAVRDRAAGLWNHVRLRSTGPVVVADPLVTSTVPDPSRAALTISVPVRNASTRSATATLTAAFDGITLSQRVTLAAGQSTTVVFAPDRYPRLRLSNPKLWWPNGYGDPNLHELRLTATVHERVSDQRTTRFGIREFRYESKQPIVVSPPGLPPPVGNTAVQTVTFAEQTARFLRIYSGHRATPWGVSMWTLSVFHDDQPEADLALHRPASASSVDSDTNAPGNVTDGNPQTRWSSAYRDGQWIEVDLGAPVAFTGVIIAWEFAYARDFVVQVCDDGQAWRDVTSVSNAIEQLKISVNGVPVLCRGGNWGWDELLRRVPPERIADTVAMHRDMNFTMIRNWIGSSNREELYRACDEQGILVWNDFWEAFLFDDNQPGYLDIAADAIRRFRIHPCIVVWCGANESVPPAGYNAGLAAAVEREHPGVAYVSDSADGIVSGHGPYKWIAPEKYHDRATYDVGTFGFHTEIGMPVIPVTETMRNLVGDEAGWPIGEVWNHHDWSATGNQQVGTYQAAIEARLGQSRSLDEFCVKAQLVNYESHRAMFEAWNANLWHDATGLLLWMSHPAWYSTVWQTYDYDLDVNGAYFGARKGCEPLHVQADPVSWQVLAVNHTAAALTGVSVSALAADRTGRTAGPTQRATVDVAASATAPAFAVAAAPASPPLQLVRLELRSNANRLLSENTYWRYRDPADLRALNTLAPARLAVTTVHSEHSAIATVTNRSGPIAALIRLAALDGHGRRVLPAFYSDNYLWLLPGEFRTIRVWWPDHVRPQGGVRISARPYNA